VLLIVWIVAVVLALVVLGAVAYGVFGAFSRLGREVVSFDKELRPVLDQAQAVAARAAESRERRQNED
jgi:hypothetical protein